MPFLIDGYNLLFAAGFHGQERIEPGTLDRARRTLVDFITRQLPAKELRNSVIVFDAKKPPLNASDGYDYRGLQIRFARNHAEADDLIIELIRKSSVPRKLCVVSSDNQIRTAGLRRRTQLVTSEKWIEQLESGASSTVQVMLEDRSEVAEATNRDETIDAEEIDAWLEFFAGPPPERQPKARRVTNKTNASTKKQQQKAPENKRRSSGTEKDTDASSTTRAESDLPSDRDFDWGPFPPGYGEDLDH